MDDKVLIHMKSAALRSLNTVAYSCQKLLNLTRAFKLNERKLALASCWPTRYNRLVVFGTRLNLVFMINEVAKREPQRICAMPSFDMPLTI